MANEDMKHIIELIYRNLQSEKVPDSFYRLCREYGIDVEEFKNGGQVGFRI